MRGYSSASNCFARFLCLVAFRAATAVRSGMGREGGGVPTVARACALTSLVAVILFFLRGICAPSVRNACSLAMFSVPADYAID